MPKVDTWKCTPKVENHMSHFKFSCHILETNESCTEHPEQEDILCISFSSNITARQGNYSKSKNANDRTRPKSQCNQNDIKGQIKGTWGTLVIMLIWWGNSITASKPGCFDYCAIGFVLNLSARDLIKYTIYVFKPALKANFPHDYRSNMIRCQTMKSEMQFSTKYRVSLTGTMNRWNSSFQAKRLVLEHNHWS
jgi:hypothetical protein